MTDQAREAFKKWFTKKYGFLPSIIDETLWEAFVAAYDLGLSAGREQAAQVCESLEFDHLDIDDLVKSIRVGATQPEVK